MRKRLALILVIFMGLGWYHFRDQEPDLNTWGGIVEKSAELTERMVSACNDLNEFSYVSCDMSIRDGDWTLDLNYRQDDPFGPKWEAMVELICTMSSISGIEPEITVNGEWRLCGGMEI